jgi:hypothetical protein
MIIVDDLIMWLCCQLDQTQPVLPLILLTLRWEYELVAELKASSLSTESNEILLRITARLSGM